jgi:type II secretory pathway component PulF
MPVFKYEAMRNPGEVLTGEVEAADERAAADSLVAKGLHVLNVEDAESASKSRHRMRYGIIGGLKRRDQVQFTRDLAALLKAGLPLVQSLGKLRTRAKDSPWAVVSSGLQARLEDGQTFSESLTIYPDLFDSMYVNLIHSGEEGGTLPEVLARLADIGEKRDEIRSRVSMAMIYPAVMLGLGVVTVIILLTFVVPMFTEIFADTGQVLPLPTLVLMHLSGFMQHWWWVVVTALGGGIFFSMRFSRSKQGHDFFGKLFLATPELRKVVTLSEVASFARTMGTLLSNGIPVVQALDVTAETLRNASYQEDVRTMREAIHDGDRLSAALERLPRFPDLVASVASVGEESGTLSESLQQVADDYERDLEREIKIFMTLLEPAMIVAVGMVVGFIVMAIILPIFQLGDAFV